MSELESLQMKTKFPARHPIPKLENRIEPSEDKVAFVSKEMAASFPAFIATAPAKEGSVNRKIQKRSMEDRYISEGINISPQEMGSEKGKLSIAANIVAALKI